MSDKNILGVDLVCEEITEKAIVTLLIDLDKVVDNGTTIKVTRDFLERIGDMATWYHT